MKNLRFASYCVAFALFVALVSAVLFCARPAGPELVDGGAELAHPHFAAAVPGIGNVNLEGTKATYGYNLGQLSLLAGVNFGVVGSDTKVVKITHVKVGPSTATALGVQDLAFRTFSVLPGDAAFYFLFSGYGFGSDAGASSTAKAIWYDIAATGGTMLASLRDEQMLSVPVATFSAPGNTLVWDFCNGRPEQCPTIIGSGQAALITVSAGGALSGQKADVEIDWTEE